MNRTTRKVILLIAIGVFGIGHSYGTDLTGRISLRSYVISQPDNPFSIRYVAPSTWIRFTLNDLFAPGLDFSFYFRGDRRMGEDEFTRNKLYDFRLTTPRLLGRVQIAAGRLNTPIAGSYGLLDGMNLKLFVKPWLSIGAFGGAVPDYRNLEIDTETQRYGGYVEVDSKKYNGFVSFITQRYQNYIDRQYVAFQNDLSIREFLTIFNSVEVDVKNLDEGKTINDPQLTYFYFNTRFVPFKVWTTDLSFTYRQDFKYLRSMSFLPDSLFNAVVSRSFGVRMRLRPFQNWTFTGNFRYGFRNDNNAPEKYAYLNVANNNLLNKRIYISVRMGRNKGYYADSKGWYLFLEKSLFRKLRLSATYLWNQYKSVNSDYEYSRSITGINLSYRWSRHLNTYIRFDRVLGNQNNQSRFLMEFSYYFLKDRKNENKHEILDH